MKGKTVLLGVIVLAMLCSLWGCFERRNRHVDVVSDYIDSVYAEEGPLVELSPASAKTDSFQ